LRSVDGFVSNVWRETHILKAVHSGVLSSMRSVSILLFQKDLLTYLP